ncbi:DNA polymerase III subunit delta' [Asticcacaulis sp. ZE23SCel15]|uniref:DNA polymerase III subunit delta' n=1 Tax=Asticcacaulis sp. ZE23SCel15 TaxID=3059027 RepID=UPI0026601515|nr:DNA polymerase III subunit delta' [Asticcacaulis sp. ZE23SCel15]WKL56632.1 DNA polymerase III subunit delta' [Asticcacaulis sp. ZE23SCel15]
MASPALVEDAALHPRNTYEYRQNEVAEQAFMDAYGRGRLHHAWLLCGPQGLGKATFAYRAAKFLMGKVRDPSLGLMGVSPQDPDAKLIAAQSHPDMLAIEREANDSGKLKKNISVEAIREVGTFFSKAPSRSPYRVAIIDSVDDLNINSANALLKILEEPPERGILFLVSHSPGKLLATIRSRCRRLTFAPWQDEAVRAFIEPDVDVRGDDLARLISMAKGSPGRALKLWQDKALDMDDLAGRILSSSPPPRAELIRYATEFKTSSARSDGAKKFSLFMDMLCEQVRERALSSHPYGRAKQWADLWARLSTVTAETEAVNLDRGEYFWALCRDIREIA